VRAGSRDRGQVGYAVLTEREGGWDVEWARPTTVVSVNRGHDGLERAVGERLKGWTAILALAAVLVSASCRVPDRAVSLVSEPAAT